MVLVELQSLIGFGLSFLFRFLISPVLKSHALVPLAFKGIFAQFQIALDSEGGEKKKELRLLEGDDSFRVKT